MSDPGAGWLDAYLSQQPEAAPAASEDVRPGEWRGVWSWIELVEGEVLPASLELLARARTIADELGTRSGAVVFGHGVRANAETLGEHGADAVYVLDDERFADFYLEAAREALVELVHARRPELLLFPATIQGRNLAAQLATALGTGIVPNCRDLTLDATERLVIGHQTSFEERLVSEIVCPTTRPQVFTLTPGTARRPAREPGRRAQVHEVQPPTDLPAAPRVRAGATLPERPRPLASRDAVVAAGLGVASRDGFELTLALARELDAYAGATRGAIACGWAEPERLITFTRQRLRPRLYLACGVVGEYDHLRAIENADFVVALTSNPAAPIAERADLIGIGEPEELLPRLLNHIREAKRERTRLGPETSAKESAPVRGQAP